MSRALLLLTLRFASWGLLNLLIAAPLLGQPCGTCTIQGPTSARANAAIWIFNPVFTQYPGECDMDGDDCVSVSTCRLTWTLYAASGWSVVHLCSDPVGANCVGGIGTSPHPSIGGLFTFSWSASQAPLPCGSFLDAYILGDTNGVKTLLGEIHASCAACPIV